MPRVFIPPALKSLCGNAKSLELEASSVRDVIAALEERFPGAADRLCRDGRLTPGLAVVINGRASSLGIHQAVAAADEIHFLPAIGGG